MTLPSHYTTATLYMEDALSFLEEHQWIYNYPNTHILVEKIFSKIPSEWVTHFTLNQTAALHENDDISPLSLKNFLARLDHLKPDVQVFGELQEVIFPKNARVGAKKRHEIVRLASLVKRICNDEEIDFVIDIGSGLGYLSRLLSEEFSLQVLGVEGCKERVEVAQAQCENVEYIQHYITEASMGYLEETIERKFPNNGDFCLVGLHACADLSVTVLDLFLKMKRAKSLVIMPCCYHRLETQSESFLRIPVSRVLKGTFTKLGAHAFLRTPFLRLACQQADAHWKNMNESERKVHAKNLLFRAVLQEVAEEENLRLSRLKRKSGGNRTKCDTLVECDIRSLIANFRISYALTSKDGVPVHGGVIEEKISAKWALHENKVILVEALAAFQAAIQSLCENIVLLDRVEYLRENGVSGCRVYKVTDERVSPRCFALVASK